ncbi:MULTISPECIES: flagellin [unclassified Novosphingobium]|uniref:flagellin N-terminal helical domain-containing protein n=1 Tax=Novosphingobium TaxID=165696 RepID=UPI00146C46D0|nr:MULTISPECIES: flagellin [unclassified Novosphingobium]NMN03015.1 flagellar hook-associated protein 3 FlgL [Novosphingobium sp. SG919]NMN86998.1 flagellar hook-associated protein 3 FlgL [Novosphingobium sp. SG916]
MSTSVSTTTSAFYERSSLDLTSLRAQMEQVQTQISSGNRLAASSDDPLTASRLRNLQRQDAISKVDAGSANRATADLNLTDSAMTEMINSLQRARQLANQAATGTLSNAQRTSIGNELVELRNNLVSLANTRDSAGNALFGGDASGDAYSVDATTGVVSYVGSGSAGSLELGDGQSVKRSLTGPEFLNFSTGTTSTDVFAALKAITDAISAGGSGAQSAASTALTTLDDAITSVSTGQTVVGARLSWIDLNTERQTTMSEARSQDQSTLGATDIPTAYTRLQELATVLQASQASFTKISGLSLFNMMS